MTTFLLGTMLVNRAYARPFPVSAVKVVKHNNHGFLDPRSCDDLCLSLVELCLSTDTY